MATTPFIFKDAEVTIDGVDLSDAAITASLTRTPETQDQTAMGDDTRQVLSGLKNWSMDFTFHQDFKVSGGPDAVLQALIGGAAVTVTIMSDKTAGVSTSNPKYTGSAVCSSYNPMSGSVGDIAVASATFVAAGDLTRATA